MNRKYLHTVTARLGSAEARRATVVKSNIYHMRSAGALAIAAVALVEQAYQIAWGEPIRPEAAQSILRTFYNEITRARKNIPLLPPIDMPPYPLTAADMDEFVMVKRKEVEKVPEVKS